MALVLSYSVLFCRRESIDQEEVGGVTGGGSGEGGKEQEQEIYTISG
jgi:hypothetical protein